MVPAGRTTDLTGEALPDDLILIRGQGPERVTFQVWGARIEVLPEDPAVNQTSDATGTSRPAVAEPNHRVAFGVLFVLGFILGAVLAGTLGATTALGLLVGAAAAAIVFALVARRPQRRAGKRGQAG